MFCSQKPHTVEPLLRGHPFCIRKVAFQEGWPLIRGRNQYTDVQIYIVKWPFQRGRPLIRVASQKGFHCIINERGYGNDHHYLNSDCSLTIASKLVRVVANARTQTFKMYSISGCPGPNMRGRADTTGHLLAYY